VNREKASRKEVHREQTGRRPSSPLALQSPSSALYWYSLEKSSWQKELAWQGERTGTLELKDYLWHMQLFRKL
jgi:hypothetical protein